MKSNMCAATICCGGSEGGKYHFRMALKRETGGSQGGIIFNQRKREELTEKSGKLEEKIREADERLKAAERMKNTEILMTLDVLDRFSGETGLTAEMADALVKKVTVYAKDRVEIEWDFSEDVYGFIMGE